MSDREDDWDFFQRALRSKTVADFKAMVATRDEAIRAEERELRGGLEVEVRRDLGHMPWVSIKSHGVTLAEGYIESRVSYRVPAGTTFREAIQAAILANPDCVHCRTAAGIARGDA